MGSKALPFRKEKSNSRKQVSKKENRPGKEKIQNKMAKISLTGMLTK